MKKDYINISNLKIPVYTLDTLIVGSGCAGLNAADWLYDFNVNDIAIATEGLKMGTSRNTGSDKQTYYKLSISSDDNDSVCDMAQSLFSGKGVNGDTAYIESSCSIRSFIKLVNLGVLFPTNIYGDFVGYMTDHDKHKRATSAGPLTSKYMVEALEKSVKSKNIRIFDNTQIFKLLEQNGKIIGAVGINTLDLSKDNKGFVMFNCSNLILATGGPAVVYENSVYPESQSGMTGMAIEIGAETSNLQEWQYGLASVDFKWNVSGTYQQVIPRYISVDKHGKENEFLNDYFNNPIEALNYIFQKGYQWPFDCNKINGSSIIDLIVYNEIVNNGNKVYLDFRNEPKGLENGLNVLSQEAYDYLRNSDALISTPIKRLEKMNKKAIDLYKQSGIDLYKEPLRISVCAQHNNGGLSVDLNWETNIKGLYAAGEIAGTFGVYRPGGSALNSTQVGSLRAAEHIAYKQKYDILSISDYEKAIKEKVTPIFEQINKNSNTNKYNDKINNIKLELQHEMSSFAAHIRNSEKINELKDKVTRLENELFEIISEFSYVQIPEFIKLRDLIITQKSIFTAMGLSCSEIGSRGGALVLNGTLDKKNIFKINYRQNDNYDNKIICTVDKAGKVKSYFKEVRGIPKTDTWFENVWNDYLRRNGHV